MAGFRHDSQKLSAMYHKINRWLCQTKGLYTLSEFSARIICLGSVRDGLWGYRKPKKVKLSFVVSWGRALLHRINAEKERGKQLDNWKSPK